MAQEKDISVLAHPTYQRRYEDWVKWRLTYEANEDFRDTYLERFSNREETADFNSRKKITPIPAFARAAVNEIKNAIFQRSHDVTRIEGDPTYQSAVKGFDGGVDLRGSSMNGFIGQYVLPELLALGRVGVYVDMPSFNGNSLADQKGARPYLYVYKTEQIRNWYYDKFGVLRNILLERCEYKLDPETGLPVGNTEYREYLHLFLNPLGTVTARTLDEKQNIQTERVLEITKIPFVVLELTDSLLRNAADYQIALLNLESSDIGYVLKSNFPFYVEQVDPRTQTLNDYTEPVAAKDATEADTRRNAKEVRAGVAHGRTYAVGANAPGFIAPPTEPLEASMKKQERMKADIRLIVNLSVSNLNPGRSQSAEAKKQDLSDLESGLSCVGLELERGEAEIAKIWAQYMASPEAKINYPETYTIKTPEERREEVASLSKEMTYIPVSNTYKKEVAKRLARTSLGTTVPLTTIATIEKEIDKAEYLDSSSDTMQRDIEQGIASRETVAKARGYPNGEAERANKEHAERLRIIKESQGDTGSARGISDESVDPKLEAKNEKTVSQAADSSPDGKQVRGKGR